VSGPAALGLLVFCHTMSVGAFGPLLPDVARAQALADWQLGVVAGAFGLARMAAAMPAGVVAGRRPGRSLAAGPAVMLAGMLVLAASDSFAGLVLGRLLMGLAHTLGMVAGLTAVLQHPDRAGASFRLNTLEFSGMLGILAGLAVVGLLPAAWPWQWSFLAAGTPVLGALALMPVLRRRFPDAGPARRAEAAAPAAGGRPPGIVWVMFGLGVTFALSWSAVSQFLLPVRGTRDFGLDRAGISRLFAVAQVVDLLVLLPVGRLADRLGRAPVLAAVGTVLGLGTLGVGLGSYPFFVAGCVAFGLGLAGWMLPLGVVREHTPAGAAGWWTGAYRFCVDAAIFVGPVVCGALGERGAGTFVSGVGVACLALAGWLWLGRGGGGRAGR
jgi:MFS family permease